MDGDDAPTEAWRGGSSEARAAALPARYEDRGPIGRGGMGEVRRVYDRHLDRMLAMKILAPELVEDRPSRARFTAEAKITAALQHPGIVAVHDQGVLADGRLWFTMREVQGRTLSDVIDELHAGIAESAWPMEPASLFRVVDAFKRVCDAVAFAHSRSVIHRDIKPSNVMVGEFGEVLVMDWGLAKERGGGSRDSVPPPEASVTHVGDVVGTPSYMPPEQARGEHAALGPRSDVWSLGAVLRTVLTGRPPASGSSAAVLAAIMTNAIVPIAEAVELGHPPMPPELVAICERAMSFEPSRRYADATEVGGEVAAWLEGDLVYVPGGWFWSGGDPAAVESLPRRKVWVDGMLVDRHPVTNEEYIRFLDELVSVGREDLALRYAPRSPPGTHREDEEPCALDRGPDGRFVLPTDENGVTWRMDWPVSLIDWHSAVAFADHLSSRRGRLFRLPDELEWEKLARGVDGRAFAFGDHVEPSWACIMGSAGNDVPGRVSVHAFETDESPYGARGTTGNVREWCLNVWRPEGPPIEQGRLVVREPEHDDPSLRAARGGAWHSLPELARAAARFAGEPRLRFAVLGMRAVSPYR